MLVIRKVVSVAAVGEYFESQGYSVLVEGLCLCFWDFRAQYILIGLRKDTWIMNFIGTDSYLPVEQMNHDPGRDYTEWFHLNVMKKTRNWNFISEQATEKFKEVGSCLYKNDLRR